MKKIFYNEFNLKEKEITEKIIRVKALIFNSNNQIMVGYCSNKYQFIGGHLEDGESLLDCLNREIREETGIVLKIKEKDPFLMIEMYCKDYPSLNINRDYIVYYFDIKTDLSVNINNLNYTIDEKDGNFEVRFINLEDFEKEIEENYIIYPEAKTIGEEMIRAFKEYKK